MIPGLRLLTRNSLAIAFGTNMLLAAGIPLVQLAKAPAASTKAPTMQQGPSMNTGGQMGPMDEHMRELLALHDSVTSANTLE